MWNNDKYRSGRGLPVGDADPDIACRRCTQKLSMDVQFAKTVNGILANAPDWVLAAIAAAPDAFLHEIDYGVWPCVNALTQIQPGELTPSREVLAKLRKDSAGSTAWHEHVRDILGLLTRGEKRPWWSSVLSGGRLRS
jgi:hypothetical protein